VKLQPLSLPRRYFSKHIATSWHKTMSAAQEVTAKKPEASAAPAADAGKQEKETTATTPSAKGTKRMQEDADDDDAFNNAATSGGAAESMNAEVKTHDANADDGDAHRPKRARKDAPGGRGGPGARLGGGRSRGGRSGGNSDRSFANESSVEGEPTTGEGKTADASEGQQVPEGQPREVVQHRDRRKDLNRGGNFNTERSKLWKEGDVAAEGEGEDDGPRLPVSGMHSAVCAPS
jgi:hypothetical protein